MRTFADRWMRFWFEPSTPVNLAVCRILCFGAFVVLHARYDVAAWGRLPDELWMPIPLFELLHVPKPAPEPLWLVSIVWKLALLTSCLGLFTRVSTAVSALLGLYILGLPHNFGYQDLANALEVFVLAIMALSRCGDALSLDRLICGPKRRAITPSGEYTWPVRCVWLMLALVFFAAGYAKLSRSGLEWIVSDNFATLMTHEDHVGPLAAWGAVLARHSWACMTLAAATIALEILYPLALVSWRARLAIVPGVFVMQVAILLQMDLAFYPFLICTLFWVPWDRVSTGLGYSRDVPAFSGMPRVR
jgi:hypothetical protein